MNKKTNSLQSAIDKLDLLYLQYKAPGGEILLYPQLDENGDIRISFCQKHTGLELDK